MTSHAMRPVSVATDTNVAEAGLEEAPYFDQADAQSLAYPALMIHQVTAETHQFVQRLLAETHMNYLAFSESALRTLDGGRTIAPAMLRSSALPASLPRPRIAVAPVAAAPTPITAQRRMVAPAPVAPPSASSTFAAYTPPRPAPVQASPKPVVVAPAVPPPAPIASAPVAPAPVPAAPVSFAPVPPAPVAPTPVVPSPVVSPVAAVATPVPAASAPVTPPAAGGNADESANTSITELLLKTVAENTGYPPEALNLQMSLEAELGIDSIKRVQILSAVQESIPNLPDLNTAQLASLETLGEIVDFLAEQVASKKKMTAAVAA